MGRSKTEFDNLIIDISNMEIDNLVESDTCVWSLSNDDSFSMNSVRKHIDEHSLPSLFPCTRWYKMIPKKNLVRSWIDLPLPSFLSCEDWTNWFDSWHVSKDKKSPKRRKLSEEAQEDDDLRKRLEIVQDEDDDVFIEATPLAQKVPVVDYQIVVIDNKPKYTLSRFTLEQLVNVARLQVEEESEMSLELLRFTRQQLQEYQQGSWLNTFSMKLKIKLVEQRQKLNV
nr:RNA-directed DNA polymerase, eukaryota, reverse transcriptase zinc-binding domain protein [Tanacetum cinerariifolium]